MSNRTVKKYENLITRLKVCPYIKESEIIYFRKFIANSGSVGQDLLRKFNELSVVRVYAEQSDKGLTYLKTKLFKLNGDLRKGAPIEAFDADAVKHILDNFSHFTMDELRPCGWNTHLGSRYVTPVYTAHAVDGSYFSYHVSGMGEIFDYTVSSCDNRSEQELVRMSENVVSLQERRG